MAYLKINKIICEVPEETDKDEIYLMHRGQKIWPEHQKFVRIDVDEIQPIGLKVEIQKTGSLNLELWEYDLASKDDHLGTFHLDIDSLEPAEYTDLLIRNEQFAEHASYFLNWEISND